MIRNYLKIAWRTLWSDKLTSGINLLGLGVTLMIVVMYFAYHRHEHSFDSFHEDADKIYRLVQEVKTSESGTVHAAGTAPALLDALKDRTPEIESGTTLHMFGQSVMYTPSADGNSVVKRYNERDYYITDSDFFTVFNYPLLHGSGALSEPGQIVVTESTALKYFGTTDVVGNTLINNRTGNIVVTGVIIDPPLNSHLDFDFLLSRATFLQSENAERAMQSWNSSNAYHYVKTSRQFSADSFKSKFREIESTYLDNSIQQVSYYAQSITDIHLHSTEIENELQSSHLRKRNPLYLNIFKWVTYLIVLIASINYINLTTAKYIRRSKEIGVRKVVGASRRQLFVQFMSESFITVFVAGLVAVAFSFAIRQFLEGFLNIDLHIEALLSLDAMAVILGVLIAIGILAGLFPAIFLSAVEPVVSITNRLSKGGIKQSHLRKILVIVQFTIAMAVVAASVLVYQQLQFVKSANLGFDKEQLISIDINSGAARSGFESFKTELVAFPGIESVSATSRVPGEWKNIPTVPVRMIGSSVDSIEMHFFAFDQDALQTFGISLYEGLNFAGNVASDSTSVLINQTAATQLGLSDPVGKSIYLADVSSPMRIIGVVADFHILSLKEGMTPVIIANWSNPIQSIDYFTCRITGSNYEGILAHLEEVQSLLDPETPLEYHFLDDQIDRFYKEEKVISKILFIVGVLTVVIGCMGLFGLVTYLVGAKTKEVGMRKILGSSSFQIWQLLIKDILVMIVAAFILATPLAWYICQQWLQNFAFGIKINPIVFLVVGACIAFLSIITVQYHFSKLVRINPVDTL